MPIFRSPYDTRACNGERIAHIAEAIQKAHINGWVRHIGDTPIVSVDNVGSAYAHTPAFTHPMVVDINGGAVVAIDDRPWTKYNPVNGENKITNDSGHSFAVLRGELTHIWAQGDVEVLRDIGQLSLGVFASWVGENVTRRMGLGPLEQLQVTILAGLFYYGLFTNEAQWDHVQKIRVIRTVSTACHCKPTDVELVFDTIGGEIISGVEGLCEAFKEVTQSGRLADFNVGLLFHIVSGTWFGPEAAQLCSVALEHPPTWIAILRTAVDDRSYKKSQLGQMANLRPPALVRGFLQAVDAVLGAHFS